PTTGGASIRHRPTVRATTSACSPCGSVRRAWVARSRSKASPGAGRGSHSARRSRRQGCLIVSQISLLLVDDHALFREGLASLLSYQPDFTVVGEAASGEEAVERARELVPDVVLMDIDLPGIDGIEATRRIKRQLPEVRVVMLTVYDDHERLFQSIKAGAQGYLIKNIRSAELLDQLRGLARGEAAISRRMAARILEEFARLERQAEILEPDGGLSPREVQVLELVALRLSNKEIAARLSISEHTVKNHLKHILAKLQLSSRRQAAAYAVAHGLIPPPKARDE